MPAPPFGGFNPSAGLRGEWNFGNSDFHGSFSFNAAQGYRQSLVGQSASMTMMNGGMGYFGDVSQSPFVMGYQPVVGGYLPFGSFGPPMPPSPDESAGDRVQALRQRLADAQRHGTAVAPAPAAAPGGPQKDSAEAGARGISSAERPTMSVADARRLHEMEMQSQEREWRELLDRGRQAEKEGKAAVAKLYYERVARRASGVLKQQAIKLLENLSGSSGEREL